MNTPIPFSAEINSPITSAFDVVIVHYINFSVYNYSFYYFKANIDNTYLRY